MQIKTWMLECLVVAIALSTTFLFKEFTLSEFICSLAVFFTFMHAQISDRMAEKQAKMDSPDVPCYWKLIYYFLIKESLWIVFFCLIHSYSALIGCGVFIFYPIWRKIYNKYYR